MLFRLTLFRYAATLVAMKRCPQCQECAPRYVFRTRAAGTFIAVKCEACGHTANEVPMRSMEDTAAAQIAASRWENQPAQRAVPVVLH